MSVYGFNTTTTQQCFHNSSFTSSDNQNLFINELMIINEKFVFNQIL